MTVERRNQRLLIPRAFGYWDRTRGELICRLSRSRQVAPSSSGKVHHNAWCPFAMRSIVNLFQIFKTRSTNHLLNSPANLWVGAERGADLEHLSALNIAPRSLACHRAAYYQGGGGHCCSPPPQLAATAPGWTQTWTGVLSCQNAAYHTDSCNNIWPDRENTAMKLRWPDFETPSNWSPECELHQHHQKHSQCSRISFSLKLICQVIKRSSLWLIVDKRSLSKSATRFSIGLFYEKLGMHSESTLKLSHED